MPKLPAAERPRLTLEDYILFFTTRSGHSLTLHHLNQILHMHAFVKLHRQAKPVIVDMLRAVDLMRPRRSTVSPNATGAAPAAAAALSTEEATRDIDDLGWRECHVGSLLSVRAGTRAVAAPVPLASIAPAPGSAAPSPLPHATPAPARRKRSGTGRGKNAMRTRKRRMVELLTLPSVEMATSA